jgi:hypothetical protein
LRETDRLSATIQTDQEESEIFIRRAQVRDPTVLFSHKATRSGFMEGCGVLTASGEMADEFYDEKEEGSMTRTLVRDYDRLCSLIPDLSTFTFEGTGDWGGASVQLTQDGTWVAHWPSECPPIKNPFDKVVLRSTHGSLIMEGVVESEPLYGAVATVEGKYISAKFVPVGVDYGGDSSYRRANVLKLDRPLDDFLHVHGFVVDSAHIRPPSPSWLPVATPFGDMHIYYLHPCKLLFIESELPVAEDDFKHCVSAIRLLLIYLTGAPLYGASQWVAFAANGGLQHVEWNSGSAHR